MSFFSKLNAAVKLVICSKTQCLLVQNALLSPTKRTAISYKTHCYLLQNALLSPTKRNAKWCVLQVDLLCIAYIMF